MSGWVGQKWAMAKKIAYLLWMTPKQYINFVTLNGETTYGPQLPSGLWGHCIAALDEDSFMVAGGVSFYTIATSYIFNRLTSEWVSGPKMNTDRYLFKCSTFMSEAHGGHNVVVAVGGET